MRKARQRLSSANIRMGKQAQRKHTTVWTPHAGSWVAWSTERVCQDILYIFVCLKLRWLKRPKLELAPGTAPHPGGMPGDNEDEALRIAQQMLKEARKRTAPAAVCSYTG
jgi:hypothetical protein